MRIARTSGTAPKVVPKPQTGDVRLADAEAYANDHPPLAVGDQIEFGVTHELDVDGDKSWVKYGVTSQVHEGEDAFEATKRVVSFVNAAVLSAATEVANQIMER